MDEVPCPPCLKTISKVLVSWACAALLLLVLFMDDFACGGEVAGTSLAPVRIAPLIAPYLEDVSLSRATSGASRTAAVRWH